MDQLTLTPVTSVSGEVVLPGSKSLTNRALLLSALASGSTRVDNPLHSDDTLRMTQALRQLGVSISIEESESYVDVIGRGGLFSTPQQTEFFLGNAGTAIRPLTAVLSLVPGTFTLTGDQYMQERPIADLTDALIQLGARVTYRDKSGYPPFTLTGGNVNGGQVSLPGNISSQYLTSLLLALPLAAKDSEICVVGDQVSKPYLDITVGIMSQFGVAVTHDAYRTWHVTGRQRYESPGYYLVEGDASSASYFFAAAAISGEVTVRGLGVGSVQGDIRFLDVLELMGATVQRNQDNVSVRRGTLRGVDVDLNHIPDAAMTIAVVALFAEGTTTIRNIYNWRVKETDRMTAMSNELTKLGARVSTTEDSITITPPESLRPAEIDTYGDHRIAMCFSLAALGDVPITINDPDCTRKTFPGYFDVFATICSP